MDLVWFLVIKLLKKIVLIRIELLWLIILWRRDKKISLLLFHWHCFRDMVPMVHSQSRPRINSVTELRKHNLRLVINSNNSTEAVIWELEVRMFYYFIIYDILHLLKSFVSGTLKSEQVFNSSRSTTQCLLLDNAWFWWIYGVRFVVFFHKENYFKEYFTNCWKSKLNHLLHLAFAKPGLFCFIVIWT